ncbi:MAG: Tol-Pal system protein TolR [Chlamydiales bacterium]|nr:Tol-Pal system protein TolR [Chlamydiales bacterium]MCH9619451.1 Tol-Pal system protein TolR [Chlamydiales bacterium]MCH9622255.1 Tol-Pal system protein TolR [Chlamydiales bacterium]
MIFPKLLSLQLNFNTGRSMSDDEPEINLTPLIDVVFVILIMFIIIAPLLEVDRVELAQGPSVSRASVEMQSPIAIHVLKDNSIVINKQTVTLRELSAYMQRAKEQYPEMQPQLFQDKQAHFGTYQSVKNVVAAAGFDQLDVILEPE